ncbi:MAG: sulfotransferase domain-containing protein [Candidatus Omnitrophota bacterium]
MSERSDQSHRNVVIHVGFSKTGTTTLQKHVFGKHSQVAYLGKPFEDETLKTLIHQLMMQESTVYDPGPLTRYMDEKQLMALSEYGPNRKVVVVSDEMFLSYSKVRDKGVVANRIKEVFGPCRILITIRNQYDLLKSAYLSRGRLLVNVPARWNGLGVTFEDWLALCVENLDRGYISHADYYKTIDFYSRLFGRENVCVLMLEEFIHHKETYIRKLSEFLGIDAVESLERVSDAHEHREITQHTLDFELLKARFFPLHRNFLLLGLLKSYLSFKHQNRRGAVAMVEIPARFKDQLKTIFREGNRKLMTHYQLPLEQYHYPL